ncbi:hypothetical protein LTS02_015632 [Friedmanniomyces endolithicus]|nr:hypothetical protein LTS02_015632 [Friedmanniomyces endolithicus]
MTKEARSRGACWSCKLRRKKCDETRPACSACTTAAIPCFGYDAKPTWADGAERQRAKAEQLQAVVREMASLKRQRRARRKQGPLGAQDPETELSLDKTVCGIDALAITSVTSTGTRRENTTVGFAGFPEYDDSQATLLMHYFDVVFPSQFPFYNPSSSEDGRGWLLLLILRTKPLYHAALSMAAYHEQLQNRDTFVSRTCKTCAVATLRNHRFLAVKELRSHLDSFRQEERAQSFEGNIEVLACIVFLILLESSATGHSSGLQQPSRRQGTTSPVNWRKAASQTAGTFSVGQFKDRAAIIERSLATRVEQCNRTLERTATTFSPTRNDQSSQLAEVEGIFRRSQTTAATREYACAALVFVSVVVHGRDPDHPKIHESVSQVVEALKELQEQPALGMLAWPLCIAGCMATGWQVGFFKDLSMDPSNVSDLKVGNLKRSFSVVEECWRLRRDAAERPDWQRAMASLNTRILLI